MLERGLRTPGGEIRYWLGHTRPGRPALVFLPGLSADHRLFERQTERFEGSYNVLVWDAPGHGASRPFALDFSLMDKAGWLREILRAEGLGRPVLIGQSMGGYVAQCFMERYPGEALGFVCIDSAPLKRAYMTAAEIWLLKRAGAIYKLYPWEALVRQGARGCAQTAYGRRLMADMMRGYTKEEYAALAGHGYRMLAGAVEARLPYDIDCPALLLCGARDRAGSTKRYDRAWARREGLALRYIPGAGHNANTDAPELVNELIEGFVSGLLLRGSGPPAEVNSPDGSIFLEK